MNFIFQKSLYSRKAPQRKQNDSKQAIFNEEENFSPFQDAAGFLEKRRKELEEIGAGTLKKF